MKLIKNLMVILCAVVVTFSANCANAQGIAVVDLEKVISQYQKAQDVSADMKVKEAELQKFIADAQKKLKDTKSPIEKKNLEEKLSNEFKAKSEKIRKEQMQKGTEIRNNVFNTIKAVSKEKQFDIVLEKAAVIDGGTDITDDVLQILNKK